MGIIDRLTGVLRTYLGEFSSGSRESFGDPDVDAAWEELDDFLGKKTFADASGARSEKRAPEELRPDFAELGLPHGASLEECKAAYKRLLKLHHPDRHAGNAANLKKATEKTARINAAWERIKNQMEKGPRIFTD